MQLKIGGVIPHNVAGFYYAVRTETSKNRWPGTHDIGIDSDITRISKVVYEQNGKITYNGTAREESAYYLSLFTVYNMGGKEIVSSPKTCRCERPLKANLFWEVKQSIGQNFRGELTLLIEVSGNRPMTRVPELVLCVCESSQHLLSHNDVKAKHLLKITAVDLDPLKKTYKNSYDVKTNVPAKQLKGMTFFLFEATPVPSEKFTLRRATGFKGKI
jgi:hypothetical protein